MAKEAYYFSHDSNARRDPKILAMRNEYGSEGYGWYWMIIEMLSEQEDYKLKHTQWVTNAIAMELLCDANSAKKFVTDCIEQYELLNTDGEYFWSDSLLRRMNLKEEKRQKRVEAGKKGAEKRWKDGNAIQMLKQSDSNVIAKDGKGKERKVKENNYSPEFEQFWNVYPRKIEKQTAYTKFKKTIKKHSLEAILDGTKKYAESVKGQEQRYVKHPSTFLNNSSFIDVVEEQPQDKPVIEDLDKKRLAAYKELLHLKDTLDEDDPEMYNVIRGLKELEPYVTL